MEAEKILTVIIPAYNVAEYIEETLDSLIENEEILKYLDIIVVNDGSKDETLLKITPYCERYPQAVSVIDKENGGHGSTINAGIERAQGKYLKVIDGDDWVINKGLTSLVDFLKENREDIDVVVNPYEQIFMDTGKIKYHGREDIETKKVYSMQEVSRMGQPLLMPELTYLTVIFQENNIRIDEKMFYVDTEFILYPIPYVEKIVFLKDKIYQYRMGTVTQSMNIVNMQKNREMHKRVLFSICEYYEQNQTIFTESQKVYYLKRVECMISTQVNTYITMRDTGTAKKEMQQFMEQCKAYHLGGMGNKKSRLLEKTGYKFFGLFGVYYRLKMHL